MLRGVRFSSTPNVPLGHKVATARGVEDVLKVQQVDRLVDPILTDPATSNWLQSLATYHQNGRGQVNIAGFADTLTNSSVTRRPERTADFVLLGDDLGYEGLNFVFGITQPVENLSIQSIYRFRQYTGNTQDQELCTRHVARHEFGHMRGMNETYDYANPDMRGGHYEGHCQNECTMHQVDSAKETLELAKALEGHRMAGFCVDCVARLLDKRLN